MIEENRGEVPSGEAKSKAGSLTFDPPVYIQRYLSVVDILQDEPWKNHVCKVVDFGCAELKLFNYLKRVKTITHVCAVDIEENLILKNVNLVKPLHFDYISGFSRKLTVDLFCGSIAEPDERLMDVDAVICIELIEHLYAEVLDLVPSTVFEHLKPKLAIFTTPNADFNVLFDLKKFRHDDHKFEWTRAEFKEWCSNIIAKYPNYEVSFKGIGSGPEGTEHLGCCSQMAVFALKNIYSTVSTSELATGKPYKLLETIEYPFKEDLRSEDQKFCDEITYRVSFIITSKRGVEFQRYDSKYEIPLSYLWDFLKNWCATEEILRQKLLDKSYVVEKNDENSFVLVYDFYNSGSEFDETEESCEEDDDKTAAALTDEDWDC